MDDYLFLFIFFSNLCSLHKLFFGNLVLNYYNFKCPQNCNILVCFSKKYSNTINSAMIFFPTTISCIRLSHVIHSPNLLMLQILIQQYSHKIPKSTQLSILILSEQLIITLVLHKQPWSSANQCDMFLKIIHKKRNHSRAVQYQATA